MNAYRARKRFGQHFLHDPAIISRIVDSIELQPGETLIEIGPGKGAITIPLLRRYGVMQAIELDRDLVPLLKSAAAGKGELTIHQADALKFDFCAARKNGYPLRVIGNLPYNISTPLLFRLLAQVNCISAMFLMLQKEVVDRMTARPGNKIYGRLTVMLAAVAEARKLFDIGRGAFSPAPAVESAFCSVRPRAESLVDEPDRRRFASLVSAAFSARRKTLRNGLRNFLTAAQIESCGIDPVLRPEMLTPEQFALLAKCCRKPDG